LSSAFFLVNAVCRYGIRVLQDMNLDSDQRGK
jgi:hypothetical protein